MQKNEWFAVDKSGFAQLMTRRGTHLLVAEPIANAFDQNVTYVRVTLEAVPDRPQARLVVEDDDPNGFEDLAHAWTMFRNTSKRKDPSKRGRFNLGEKAILSICSEAHIATTTGTVVFDDNGRRRTAAKREAGSVFDGTLKLTRKELAGAEELIRQLVPPTGVTFTFNGDHIPAREPVVTIECTLPTEAPDPEGYLRRTARKTTVNAYAPTNGETPMLYELGIPVVELPDHPWHVDVQQRVPLNVERDNVTPSFKRTINVLLLNHLHKELDIEQATSDWAREASGDDRVEQGAIATVMDLRFGSERVSYDPSDPEANSIATAKGMTVVTGGSLSKNEWANVKRFDAVKPAGRVTPSPRVLTEMTLGTSDELPDDRLSAGMKGLRTYIEELTPRVMNGCKVKVSFVNKRSISAGAFYGSRTLTFNIARLGRKWFDGRGEKQNDLIIHELGHEYEGNHLSTGYYKALTQLGAALVALALTDPGFFQRHGFEASVHPQPAPGVNEDTQLVPDLLAACKAALEMLITSKQVGRVRAQGMRKLRAAIAKAKNSPHPETP